MSTPWQFEQDHAPSWLRLEHALHSLEEGQAWRAPWKRRQFQTDAQSAVLPASQLLLLHRQCCEHLALARSRHYPLHLCERLDQLAQRAHRQIYRQRDYGLARLYRLFAFDFPQSLRAHWPYVLIAAAVFVLPMVGIFIACKYEPGFVLTLLDSDHLREMESMYRDDKATATRKADTDWGMFGYYIMHNTSIALNCFASGFIAGVGSLLALFYNGLMIGAVAAHLDNSGLGHNFWPFVATHGAFELTAIVISGATGLALGHSLLAPGRHTRLQSLRQAALACVPMIYGFVVMLIIAAAIEAFWSPSRWVGPTVKYAVAAAAWFMVFSYFIFQGRRHT